MRSSTAPRSARTPRWRTSSPPAPARPRGRSLLPEAPPEAHAATSLVVASREAFAAWVDVSRVGRAFGQVLARRVSGGYSLRHVDDAEASDLAVFEDPRAAREIARLTETGEHRPLKSSPNLRRGGGIRGPGAPGLAAAMKYPPPPRVAHWHIHREGGVPTPSSRAHVPRQCGKYKAV